MCGYPKHDHPCPRCLHTGITKQVPAHSYRHSVSLEVSNRSASLHDVSRSRMCLGWVHRLGGDVFSIVVLIDDGKVRILVFLAGVFGFPAFSMSEGHPGSG